MVAKVAGGVIGLGLIGTGGVAFVKPEWLGINRETWKPLSQDNDFSNTNSGYKSKFGETYKNYLTGVKGNQGWWKESFERLKEDSKKQNTSQQPSAQFKFVESGTDGKVTLAFDDSEQADAKALNQICKKIYRETDTNIKQTVTNTTNEYKDVDVWKYCSPVGAVPKKVSEQTEEEKTYGNGIGKSKKEELLSIKSPNNQELWKLKNDEFFGTGAFSSITKRTFPSDEHFFKKLFEEGSEGENSLRDKCEEAYKLTSDSNPNEAGKTKDVHVVKYCSSKPIQ